jgi:uncharacterized repeat protein (TIGR03803 family)
MITRKHPPTAICGIVILFLTSAFGSSALAQHIQSFSFNKFDGADPQGGLVAAPSGKLYGTTSQGGSRTCFYGCGTAFEISPPSSPGGPWTGTLLYSFGSNSQDGTEPYGSMVFDSAGNLYGVTLGGENSAGTVFELSPPAAAGAAWTETVLYRFAGGSDGSYPMAGPVFDQAGNLYGTTEAGGDGSGGIVWELSPPSLPGGSWTETVLHSFSGADGWEPLASLVLDTSGNLYGTTFAGGDQTNCNVGFGCGVVFELSPPSSPGDPWIETALHVFVASVQGISPDAGLILDKTGALFGTTDDGGSFGGGVLFGLKPPARSGAGWTYSVLHSFGGSGDGDVPVGNLTRSNSGTIYGVTQYTSDQSGDGTIFQVIPPASPGGEWAESLLYSFTGASGAHPVGGLIIHTGALWGTTSQGGSKNDGVVFKLSP